MKTVLFYVIDTYENSYSYVPFVSKLQCLKQECERDIEYKGSYRKQEHNRNVIVYRYAPVLKKKKENTVMG